MRPIRADLQPCPHPALMELRTAKEMLAEYLDARPSEVEAMIRERIAERFSVLDGFGL
ncbi:MAG: hypothetical protein A4E45_00131 [Methanosaeta sp. PtaB.Bin039]|nr:MAG: hypothetical protein A4E45_00131 [Methanosaeta sp. PtaB.Bin039]OPY45427.1 MAG: hypothetical protein A4E47_00975 [Methanosaeta sp. PtaU1.Bin028]